MIFFLKAITEIKKLETNRDLEGLFTTEQAERIDARIEVRCDLVDDKGKLGEQRNINHDILNNKLDYLLLGSKSTYSSYYVF